MPGRVSPSARGAAPGGVRRAASSATASTTASALAGPKAGDGVRRTAPGVPSASTYAALIVVPPTSNASTGAPGPIEVVAGSAGEPGAAAGRTVVSVICAFSRSVAVGPARWPRAGGPRREVQRGAAVAQRLGTERAYGDGLPRIGRRAGRRGAVHDVGEELGEHGGVRAEVAARGVVDRVLDVAGRRPLEAPVPDPDDRAVRVAGVLQPPLGADDRVAAPVVGREVALLVARHDPVVERH